MPRPSSATATTICHASIVRDREQQEADAAHAVPSEQRHLRAHAPGERPGERAGHEHHRGRGQHEQARRGDAGAEAVAGCLRHLHELRHEDERAEHAEADQEAGEVGGPDAAQPQQVDVDERLAARAARSGPRSRAAPRPPGEQAERSRAEPQPQRLPSLTASRNAVRPADRSAAPPQSIRAGDLTGDSGTTGASRRRRSRPPRARTRRSSGRTRWSTIRPLSTSPAPPPIPKVAEIRPMPVATRSRGNSSRMIPKASGNTAPAAPCTARPATSSARLLRQRRDQRPDARTGRARPRACAPCRTCRRAGRGSAWRSRRVSR